MCQARKCTLIAKNFFLKFDFKLQKIILTGIHIFFLNTETNKNSSAVGSDNITNLLNTYIFVQNIYQIFTISQRTTINSEHIAMMVELKTVLSVVGLMCLNILFSALKSVN